jgi:Ca2+-binding RTX toxin-like protein
MSLVGQAWAICPMDGCAPNLEADCYEICTPVTVGGKVTVVCDLDVTETTDLDATGTAVNSADGGADICGSGDYYCAWGWDTSGRQFYCGWTTYGGDLVGVNLRGGQGEDALSFMCEESPNPLVEARLQEYVGFSHSVPFLGRIDGGPGNDTIIGSSRADAKYADALYGWDGNDDMAGHEGDDYIDAGTGQDRICAGPGNDVVNACPGHDDVCGESGTNTINGGTGGDRIHGGSGSSTTIEGGPDYDICDPTGTNCEDTSTLLVCDGTTTLHECPS